MRVLLIEFFIHSYLALIGIWVFGVLRTAASKVMTLHHLMTGMVLLKCLSVLVLAVDYHYRDIVGHPGGLDIRFCSCFVAE